MHLLLCFCRWRRVAEMENGKQPCTKGLQLTKNINPNGAPSSTGSQAFKMISPVDIPCGTPPFPLFKKPSFLNHVGDGRSGTMKQYPEPSQGKLSTPDDRNKQILMQHQPSDKAPISGDGVAASSSSGLPLDSDKPGNQPKSKWDRNLNNSNMDPKKLKRWRIFSCINCYDQYCSSFVEIVPFLYCFQLSLY